MFCTGSISIIISKFSCKWNPQITKCILIFDSSLTKHFKDNKAFCYDKFRFALMSFTENFIPI